MIREMVNFACQSWFAQCTLLGLLIDWVGCHVISAVLPSRKRAEGMCCRFCHLIFRWFLIKSCPWVRVTPPLAEDVARLLDRDRVCLLMNHTSFFDSVLFVGTTPPGIIWRYRTLMKRGLFDIPLLGGICRKVGHFPVFFRSKDEDSFVVDKTAQAEIMEKVREHVRSNGSLCLFPEGKINRNPATLCPFRRGTFSIVEEMDMAVVTLTTVGGNDTWPVGAAVGGLPARILMKITEVAVAGHGLSSAAIQEKAEASMQADVTFLREKRDGSKKSK